MSAEGNVADVLAGRARYAVVCGDAAEVLRSIGDGVAAAIVTDPPSGIAFMGAEWDRDKGGRAQWVSWLAGILADARRITRDGGRSVVWSLPRTSHWTGCAVEDAGWSIENTITHLFGTGWPKGKSQLKPAAETWWLARTGRSEPLNVEACRVAWSRPGERDEVDRRTCPNARHDPNSAHGEGSMYGIGGVANISDAGRYPPNVVLSHSPGCVRVGTRKVAGSNFAGGAPRVGAVYGGDGRERPPSGYADADGQEEVEAWECIEGCPVAELDAQSGDRPPGWFSAKAKRGMGYGGHEVTDDTGSARCIGDTGGASRFFPCFPADPAVFRYVAKPSSAEKSAGSGGNEHMTVKSVALMRWLVDLVTQRGDLVIDPFGGSGTTGVACLASGRRVILVERDPRFAEIARQRCAHWGAEWSAPARASKRRAKRDADEGPQPSLFDRRPEAP